MQGRELGLGIGALDPAQTCTIDMQGLPTISAGTPRSADGRETKTVAFHSRGRSGISSEWRRRTAGASSSVQ